MKILGHIKCQIYGFGLLIIISAACQTTEKNQYLKIANEYATEGLIREALDTYAIALRLEPKNPFIHRNLGLTLLRAGSYEKSIHHLTFSLKRYPRSFDILFALGEAWRGLDNYNQSVFYYQMALNEKPNNLNVLKPLAWSYFNLSLYNDAIKTIKSALKMKKNDPELFLISSHIFIKLHRYEDTQIAIEQGLSIVSENMRPYFLSIQAQLNFLKGHYDDAYKGFTEANKQKPFMTHALIGLGNYFLHFERKKEAVVYLEQAVRLKPKDPEPILLLAKAYEQMDPKKSLKFYRYFTQKFASNPEYIQQIDGVRSKMIALSLDNNARE